MNERAIIDHLEELAEGLGIKIRYEPIKQNDDLERIVGGLCLLRGDYVLIIDSKAAPHDKIRAFLRTLRHFDLDQIYIKPAIRDLLERVPPSFRHAHPSPRPS